MSIAIITNNEIFPKLALSVSLLLSMNMDFGTHFDYEFTYKLCKYHNDCFGSVITKYFVV